MVEEVSPVATALLVVGMHRSGTSAITRVLNLLGAAIGEKLIEGQVGVNDKGFWEHVEVVAFHDHQLEAYGSSWHDIARLPPFERGALFEGAVANATQVIRRAFLRDNLWLLKDPRLCLFVPVWTRALSDLSIEPRFVI